MKTMEETVTFSGIIRTGTWRENDDALFIGTMDEPLAEAFPYDGSPVSVRYWISDQPKTKEQLQESTLKVLLGVADAACYDAYSDITGYLWSTERLEIGGHDLLAELESYMGMFILLEVDIHAQQLTK